MLLVVILRVASFLLPVFFCLYMIIFFLSYSHDSMNIPKGKSNEKFALFDIKYT